MLLDGTATALQEDASREPKENTKHERKECNRRFLTFKTYAAHVNK
jgi:hypothetical protein